MACLRKDFRKFLSFHELLACRRRHTARSLDPDFWPRYSNNSSLFAAKDKRMRDRIEGKDRITVAFEGNIGCGKTTLMNHFTNDPLVEIHCEPVTKWRNMNGQNLLGLMYTDPKRWSLAFQTYVQLTMVDVHNKEQTKPVKMLERSIFSARYCFVENLFRSGKMSQLEYNILCLWFDWLIKNTKVNVDLIVYLRTEPETVHERILKRARPEEVTVPLEYLHKLHLLHEEWLGEEHYKFPDCASILKVDFNCDLNAVGQIYEQIKDKIKFARKSI